MKKLLNQKSLIKKQTKIPHSIDDSHLKPDKHRKYIEAYKQSVDAQYKQSIKSVKVQLDKDHLYIKQYMIDHDIEVDEIFKHYDIQRALNPIWGNEDIEKDASKIEKNKQISNIESEELKDFLIKIKKYDSDKIVTIRTVTSDIKKYLEENRYMVDKSKYKLDSVIKNILKI